MIKFDQVMFDEPLIFKMITAAMTPYTIDKEHNQMIREISITGCHMGDSGSKILLEALTSTKNAIYYLNLSKNHLSPKCISSLALFLDSERS